MSKARESKEKEQRAELDLHKQFITFERQRHDAHSLN